MSTTTTTTLMAMTAGRNCTLAIQPSHVWAVPVKSRKSKVSPMKNSVARVMRIFLSMIFLLLLLRYVVMAFIFLPGGC